MDPDFEDDLKYLGPLFKALNDLNFYGRLIPEYNFYIDYITYRIEKYVDIQEVMQLLKDIDYVPFQLEKKFDDVIGDWLPNNACARVIKEKLVIIRKAASGIYAYVRGLNNT